MKQIESLNISSGYGKAVFYSGKGNRKLAEKFAKSFNKTTLEMTPGGKWLDQQVLFKRFDEGSDAIKPWKRLSQRYASEASGHVNAFIKGARPDHVFNTIEYPALKANINVHKYIFRGYGF